jgi:hypothetical protein
MEYPKAKYNKEKSHVVVNNAVEEKNLGAEWFDTPDFKNNPKPVIAPPPAAFVAPKPAAPFVPPASTVVTHPAQTVPVANPVAPNPYLVQPAVPVTPSGPTPAQAEFNAENPEVK